MTGSVLLVMFVKQVGEEVASQPPKQISRQQLLFAITIAHHCLSQVGQQADRQGSLKTRNTKALSTNWRSTKLQQL